MTVVLVLLLAAVVASAVALRGNARPVRDLPAALSDAGALAAEERSPLAGRLAAGLRWRWWGGAIGLVVGALPGYLIHHSRLLALQGLVLGLILGTLAGERLSARGSAVPTVRSAELVRRTVRGVAGLETVVVFAAAYGFAVLAGAVRALRLATTGTRVVSADEGRGACSPAFRQVGVATDVGLLIVLTGLGAVSLGAAVYLTRRRVRHDGPTLADGMLRSASVRTVLGAGAGLAWCQAGAFLLSLRTELGTSCAGAPAGSGALSVVAVACFGAAALTVVRLVAVPVRGLPAERGTVPEIAPVS